MWIVCYLILMPLCQKTKKLDLGDLCQLLGGGGGNWNLKISSICDRA